MENTTPLGLMSDRLTKHQKGAIYNNKSGCHDELRRSEIYHFFGVILA
jgi:hypothetical protein